VVYNASGAAFGGLFFSFDHLHVSILSEIHSTTIFHRVNNSSFVQKKKSQLHGAAFGVNSWRPPGNKKPFPRLWKPPSSSRGDAVKRLVEWELWQPASGLYCVKKLPDH
jgi:hypothetical protein